MNSFFKAAGSAVFASVLSANAHAAIPLFTVSEGMTGFFGTSLDSRPTTVTQSFTLTENYNLTALGLLDSGHRAYNYQPYRPPGTFPSGSDNLFNQGFYGSHTVSVFNSTSGLVAQSTFAAGLTGYAGPGSLPLSNFSPNQNLAQFKYIDIAPIALTAGQYTMVSTWNTNEGDGFVIRRFNGGYTALAGATLDGVIFSQGSTIVNVGVGFASNLLLESAAVSPIPEPSEVAMMIAGLGVLGAFARRRKNRESAADAR
jgi:PEP-CTERM motif